MKNTRIFAAAVALLSVLSCQKGEQQAINNSEIEGANLITCTFAANDDATKTTTTDDKTPLWAAGDEIMLYDGSSQTQKLTLAASGEPSSSQGIIDGTDATKFTFAKPDGWTNVYAIYPYSACVSGFSASAPKINFAGQDGTFAKANICAAAEVSGTMSFKNVGAVLKFPSKPATVTDILIPVAGLAKDYTVSFAGADPSLTPVDTTHSRSYSIGSGTGEIYIGVPAENLTAGHSFIYQDSNKNILGSYTTGNANNIEKNKIYTLSAIAANGTIPQGILSKNAFSVSATKKVYFSKGNLYYNGSAWNFEDNQYYYRTYAAKNSFISGTQSATGTPANHWGAFGWSTNSTIYGMSTSTTASDYSGDFKDWGANAIVNGGNTADLWETLSSAEWNYLLKTRTVNGGTGEGKSYQRTTLTLSLVPATVYGAITVYGSISAPTVYGMIIAPDNYKGSLSANTSGSAWQTMESAGCVFLPAAGIRNGSEVGLVGSDGFYWSSTPNGAGSAEYLELATSLQKKAENRQCGHSVRLVCAAQ